MGQVDAHSIIRRFTRAGLLILLALPASAQVARKCSGRVYDSREVSKHARIIEGPKLHFGDVRLDSARGRLVLDAILCRNGHVTDIRVVEGLSPEINEFVRAAISLVKFEPAEHRWHSVSQKVRFEILFGPNEPGVKIRTSADVDERLVESVEIIGNRKLTAEQILSWIKTRPGDTYREEQVKRDFDAILATGYFDKTQTRAIIEDGVRGGVRLIFEVVELPAIKP